MNRIKQLSLASVILFGVSLSPTFAAEPLSEPQADAVRQIVRDYLLKNPEVIMEAIQVLRERQEAQAAARQRQMIQQLKPDLMASPDSPILGNPDGDVTLVEFSDYNCPYCKRNFPAIQKLVNNDGKVKVILKELPILGPGSVFAARAALASRLQGKYAEFHAALMQQDGRPDEASVMAIAKTQGLDVDRLKKDMESTVVDQELSRNQMLARRLGINGTPAFIINDRLQPGALNESRLSRLIAETRKQGKAK